MSRTELHRGTLRKIERNGLTLEELGLPILVQFKNGKVHFVESICIFKEDSWIYKLMKLFKRKKYVKYKRTHQECNEV